MKLKPTLLALAAATAAFSAPVHALMLTGNTTGGPTFNRPVSTTSLSAVGTAVAYTVLPFTVTVAGTYTFLTTTTTPAYDPFALLYTTFTPTSPLVNLLALNDDLASGNLTQSGFTFSLSTGTTYRYVTTGYDNLDFGAYTLSITGPGDVLTTAVPEPSSYAMLAFGLAGIGAVARRRNAG